MAAIGTLLGRQAFMAAWIDMTTSERASAAKAAGDAAMQRACACCAGTLREQTV
jgi:hypothetical protein